MEETKIKILSSFAGGAVLAVVFVTVVVIAADLFLPLKDWLKNVFSHHWIGKGVLATTVFLSGSLLAYFARPAADFAKLIFRIKVLSYSAVAGAVVLAGFFVWEFVK